MEKFDKVIERKGTNCIKWDYTQKYLGETDVLPLWVADMDFEAPEEVIKKLQERIEHGIFGYTERPDSYYEATINWVKKRYEWEIKRDWILFSPGVVPAINFAIQAFSNEGDGIIIQSPVYHPFFKAVETNNRKLIINELINDDGYYRIDFEALEKSIDENTKMLVFCSPHNPVGRVWKEEELRKLGEIALKNNLIIFSDEIHADIIFKGNKHIPIASLSKELAEITITAYAPSKTFNVAGLKTSNVIIPNEILREKYDAVLARNGIHLSGIFGMVALEAAYNEGEKWLDELLIYLENNCDYVIDFLKEKLPKIKVNKPEGTFLLWLDFSKYNLSDAELRLLLLKKGKIGLNQGNIFGPGGENFMRLNFACPRVTLEEAMKRLLNTFSE